MHGASFCSLHRYCCQQPVGDELRGVRVYTSHKGLVYLKQPLHVVNYFHANAKKLALNASSARRLHLKALLFASVKESAHRTDPHS